MSPSIAATLVVLLCLVLVAVRRRFGSFRPGRSWLRILELRLISPAEEKDSHCIPPHETHDGGDTPVDGSARVEQPRKQTSDRV